MTGAWELAGAKLVDFGSDKGTTREDLEQAIGENTAAVHYVAVEQTPDEHELSLEDTIDVANEHGLPVLVDAAGQIYPLENFGKYVRMGLRSSASPQSTWGLRSRWGWRWGAMTSCGSYRCSRS